MKKRMAALMAACALCIGLLAGCGCMRDDTAQDNAPGVTDDANNNENNGNNGSNDTNATNPATGNTVAPDPNNTNDGGNPPSGTGSTGSNNTTGNGVTGNDMTGDSTTGDNDGNSNGILGDAGDALENAADDLVGDPKPNQN